MTHQSIVQTLRRVGLASLQDLGLSCIGYGENIGDGCFVVGMILLKGSQDEKILGSRPDFHRLEGNSQTGWTSNANESIAGLERQSWPRSSGCQDGTRQSDHTIARSTAKMHEQW